MSSKLLLARCLLMVVLVTLVFSHGRLVKPPSRASAWRYGFTTPKNYNDNEIYCGGFGVQQRNGGKCGPCGDPWHLPTPRANENGGMYGTGLIVEKYRRGAKIEVGVELSANHRGYFEFKLCPHNTKGIPETNECFEKHVLKLENGKGTRYYVDSSSKFSIAYRLPKEVTCKQCTIQWRYVAGNNWGMCPNGTGMNGCGPQEEFRACADVTIVDEDGSADDTPHISIDDYDDTDDQDYNNEIDSSSISANYAGHVTAITLSFVFLALLILLLVVLYFWTDCLKAFFSKKKENWGSKIPSVFLIPTLNLSGSKKPNTRDSGLWGNPKVPVERSPSGAPIPPPRRNRSRSRSPSVATEEVLNPEPPQQRRIFNISAPTRVAINGVVVTPPQQGSDVDLHVPDYT